jgi:hypothetical protein
MSPISMRAPIGDLVASLQAQVVGVTFGWSMPNGVVQVGATG